jgi:hypothetical protein
MTCEYVLQESWMDKYLRRRILADVDTINRDVKIRSNLCSSGDIVGRRLGRSLHVAWRCLGNSFVPSALEIAPMKGSPSLSEYLLGRGYVMRFSRAVTASSSCKHGEEYAGCIIPPG